MKRFLALAFEGLSSFGFAVVLLFYLFVLTLVGTLQQQWISLCEVQEMYFNSYLIPGTPFPGVHLTLVLLFVNLVSGGMVRIRKSSTTAGISRAIFSIQASPTCSRSSIERCWRNRTASFSFSLTCQPSVGWISLI